MFRHAAARDPASAETQGAGFCHGAAGLAHLFNRAYQATGDDALRAAALVWLDLTLDAQKPGAPQAGFGLPQTPSDEPHADESLLSGIAGIGLVLAAATTPVEPRWDRVFACAIPPR